MTDSEKLNERIDALEVRLAYQDETIEKLNATVTAQWAQIDALTRQLAQLNERVEQSSTGQGDPASERPPHY